ncbi:MAG: phosphopantetheine-binding protein [Gammaproteobacteria bacterium]
MQSKEEILDQLIELIRPYAEEPIVLSEQTRIIDDVGLDSMKVMELVMQIEDCFDVSVPLNILPDVNTIGEFAKHLETLLQDS